MKTTLVIDDVLLDELRQQAARDGTTISVLVEAALRLYLERPSAPQLRPPPLPTFASGGHLVDVADRDALRRATGEDG